MKPKKYSESKIKTAQKFLSKYNLTFDNLDEAQKITVTTYAHFRKLLPLCLIVFVSGLVFSSIVAYAYYNRAQTTIHQITEMSLTNQTVDLHAYGKSCFGRGVNFGMSSILAFTLFLYIILLLAGLRGRLQMLNTFLPSLKQSNGDNTSSN